MSRRALKRTFLTAVSASICCWAACSSAKTPVTVEGSEPVTDVDGNVYRTVRIGDQVWTTQNLNVTHFRNGDPIPEAATGAEWVQAGSAHRPVWCLYNNDPENGSRYGRLYNWYALSDPRGLAPAGWAVPNNKEWNVLLANLGGSKEAGTKMKSTDGWGADGNGDDSGGFAGLPGGGRAHAGDFADIGGAGLWWSSLEQTAATAWGYQLSSAIAGVLQGSWSKTTGLSVRVLKCGAACADTGSSLTLAQQLQIALDVPLKSANGIGISAAVTMPDGKTWAGCSGVSHGETKITPETRFSAGSIEKMFAAATIMQLVQEGHLTLDDPVYQWLPAYPHVDSLITVRQLLSHTAGLYNYVDNRDWWDAWFREPSRVWSLEEVVLKYNRQPVFPRGTDWHYSQTGYNLLRMIIKKITGSEIPAINDERFFLPLGMAHTLTSMGGPLPEDAAHGWYDTDKDLEYEDFSGMERTPFASGIGGEVWSTPADLAKWARALFHDKTVVSQTSLAQMLDFYAPCTGEEFFSAGYGLGLARFNPELTGGIEAYGHGGHGPGYAAGCMYLPAYGVCIGIMENTDGGECIGTSMSRLVQVVTRHLDGAQ